MTTDKETPLVDKTKGATDEQTNSPLDIKDSTMDPYFPSLVAPCERDEAIPLADIELELQGVNTTTLAFKHHNPDGYVVRLGETQLKDKGTIYLLFYDDDRAKDGQTPIAYDPEHARLLTASGGVHPYYWTDKQLPGVKDTWFTHNKSHDRWPVEADTPEHWPIKPDGDYIRTGSLVPRLPLDIENMLIEHGKKNPRSSSSVPQVDMPPVIKSDHALTVDLPSEGNGRNTELFKACRRLFVRLLDDRAGSVDECMGMALGAVEPFLETIFNETSDYAKAQTRYSSVEAWWKFNKGLSDVMEEERKNGNRFKKFNGPRKKNDNNDSPFIKPVAPTGTMPRSRSLQIKWLSGCKVIEGLATIVVAATKTGKTTFTFGYLIPEAIQSGRRLIVISNETSSVAIYTYAYAHGYGDAVIRSFGSLNEPDEWQEYVLGQDGLMATLRAALEMDGGTPAVVVVESPETFVSFGGADGVEGIAGSSNFQPKEYKEFINRIQVELLNPGKHSLVWIGHTPENSKDGKMRGGMAGIEHARSYWHMHGSIGDATVYAGGNIYEHPLGIRKFKMVGTPTPLDARSRAARDAGVEEDSPLIPNFVFDDLVPDTSKGHISSQSPTDYVWENLQSGIFTASEILDDIQAPISDTSNPGRDLQRLASIFEHNGWEITRSGRKYLLKKTRIQKDGEAA